MFRHIAERISRRIVLKRRLPAEFGYTPLLVSPGAALRYWRWNLQKVDNMLLRIASGLGHHLVREGDSVWDCGANVGLLSFATASKVGPHGSVLAIEPDLWLVNLLRRSTMLKENGELRIEVLPVAVSNKVDIARFHIALRGRAANYIGGISESTQTGGIREVQLVPTITMDWLLDRYRAPTFVKIDVEGAEELVLLGAKILLSEVRPTILIEVSRETREAVTIILKKNSYTLFDANAYSKWTPVEKAAWNTLAIPEPA